MREKNILPPVRHAFYVPNQKKKESIQVTPPHMLFIEIVCLRLCLLCSVRIIMLAGEYTSKHHFFFVEKNKVSSFQL